MSRDEVERLPKVDDEMAGKYRHIHKLPVDLDLKARRAGIKDRYETLVRVGAQAPVWLASVVVDKIEKRVAPARGVTSRCPVPQSLWNARLVQNLTHDGNADSVELTTKSGNVFGVVLNPPLAAECQLGLLVVLKGNEPLELGILGDLAVGAICRDEFTAKSPGRFKV